VGVADTLRSVPRRLRDSVRQEGLWRFVARAAASPVYRAAALQLIPFEQELQEPGARPPSLAVRVAEEADMELVAGIRPQRSPDVLRRRLLSGHKCFVSLVDDRLASVRWVRTDIVDLDYLGLVLPLGGDEVSTYEVFAEPAYRHLQVRKAAVDFYYRYYLERGFHAIVGYTIPGRKPFGRHNPYRVATIRTLRLGPFRKFWVRICGPQAECWRERLRDLRWA
jgi:hypothetical protein